MRVGVRDATRRLTIRSRSCRSPDSAENPATPLHRRLASPRPARLRASRASAPGGSAWILRRVPDRLPQIPLNQPRHCASNPGNKSSRRFCVGWRRNGAGSRLVIMPASARSSTVLSNGRSRPRSATASPSCSAASPGNTNGSFDPRSNRRVTKSNCCRRRTSRDSSSAKNSATTASATRRTSWSGT